MDYFNKSIPISTGFGLSASVPLDSRTIAQNAQELLTMPNIRKYVGMPVYLIDEKIQVRLQSDGSWTVDNTGFSSGSGAPGDNIGVSGDMYIDIDEGDVYIKQITDQSTLQVSWIYITNIKGEKGEQGLKGTAGTRGSLWFTGVGITGSDTSGAIFPSSGVDNCLYKDMYLNTETGDVYQCVGEGTPDVAQWAYIGSILGPVGKDGESTAIYVGSALSGTDPIIVPDTGIEYANIGDLYLCTTNAYIYKCTLGGPADAAVWTYVGYIPAVAGVDNYGNKITSYVHEITILEDGRLRISYGNGDYETYEIGGASTAQKEDITIQTTDWVAGESGYRASIILSTVIDDTTDVSLYPIESEENILEIDNNNVNADNVDIENNAIIFTSSTLPTINLLYTARITKFVEGSE